MALYVMKNQTPLFPGFHLLSLRRKPSSTAERLADEQGTLRRKNFDQLQACFGKYLPEGCLRSASSGSLSRCRLFTKANILWAFLSQVLDADGGCREVVRKLQGFCVERSLPLPSASTAAYCKARKKLETSDLEAIFKHMAAPTPSQSAVPSLGNRRVVVADGTGLSMPDTALNQQVWPQQKNQKPGCGFPRATVCACFCLQSGLLLSYAVGNKKSHELPLFRQQTSTFKTGDIFLGDKGFTSYYDTSRLKIRGVDSVVALCRRLPVTASKAIKSLGEDDLLITWNRPKWTTYSSYPKEGWLAQPETMTLRQIKVQVREPGFRVKSFYLITTLLDPKAYPADVLAELYFQRWNVELFFRDIKTTMGLDILRCKTPEMIKKEILMHFIAYNGIRHLILEATSSKNSPRRPISFKGSLQALRQWIPHLSHAHRSVKEIHKIIAALLQAIAQNVIYKRPGRSEPRVVKRRPKPFRLMTAPRLEMSQIIQQEKS